MVVRLVSPRRSELLDETWVGGVFRFSEVPVHLAVDRSMFDDDLAEWIDLRVTGFSIAYEHAISRPEADSAACVASAVLDHAVRLLGRLPGPREWREEWFEHVLTTVPADDPAAEIAPADRERYLITYRQWLRLTGEMRDPTER